MGVNRLLFVYMSMLETDDERMKLADLYERNKYACLRTALAILHDQSRAEDALHSAFLSVITHKEKYLSLGRRDFRSAIVIIVKNKCLDLLKLDNNISTTPLDELEYSLEANDVPVDIRMIRKEEFEQLQKLISDLSATAQRLLNMKYIQGMSYDEIVAEMGITPKHAETIVYRAKVALRGRAV
ncbi:hypothetical protein FACS1894217_11220 [Clostridia bacterium]|nr:hypothetical protein FACS1894217_11220 [Clostridia bacterium]